MAAPIYLVEYQKYLEMLVYTSVLYCRGELTPIQLLGLHPKSDDNISDFKKENSPV